MKKYGKPTAPAKCGCDVPLPQVDGAQVTCVKCGRRLGSALRTYEAPERAAPEPLPGPGPAQARRKLQPVAERPWELWT